MILFLKGYKLFRVKGVAIVPQFKMQVWAIGHLPTVANYRDNVTGIYKITNFF